VEYKFEEDKWNWDNFVSPLVNLSEWEELMIPSNSQYRIEKDTRKWDQIERVSMAIQMLTPQSRFIIESLFYDRCSYQELADRLGLKAKSHVWRLAQKALEELKQYLGDIYENTNDME